MNITLDNAYMFSNMLSNYKEKVYHAMLADGYDMQSILNFCTGFGIVSESIGKTIMEKQFEFGYDILDIYSIPFVDSLDNALSFIESIRLKINRSVKPKDRIISDGITYAFDVVTYYIINVIYGATIINHDRLILDIPSLSEKIA